VSGTNVGRVLTVGKGDRAYLGAYGLWEPKSARKELLSQKTDLTLSEVEYDYSGKKKALSLEKVV